LNDTRNNLNCSGLTGTIGTDVANDLSGIYIEADVVEYRFFAVVLRQVAECDDWLHICKVKKIPQDGKALRE